jgi:phosphotransferase system enzyme I (PtsI)
MPKGIAVSPGIAVGRAYCVHEIYVDPKQRHVAPAEVERELARYERARDKTAADLRALQKKVAKQVGQSEAEIFRVHESILRDQSFTAKIRNWIVSDRLSVPAALDRFAGEYTALFSRTEDEYLRERLADVRDVIVRIGSHLAPVSDGEAAQDPGPLILIANELLPSHVVTLGERNVAGIVTQAGGRTSHAAILARSRGIPAVSGVRGVLKQVSNGELVVVDGRDGHVILRPDSEVESAFRKLQREFVHLKDTLVANADQPAVTACGKPLEILANINHVADAEAAQQMGASGVGLYRTEYLFLAHADVPDEEEQTEAYSQIIQASPNQSITIRTLDLGGDKTIPYLGHDREANPFMGWRSIRLSFEHPEFFMTQMRAVMRAAAASSREAKVRLLFPMITTLEEMRRVRGLVRRARRQLNDAGVPFRDVPIGLMVEVPAAALAIRSLVEVVDFVSIGSNDLIQYVMAADRDNPKVSHLCEPLSPAVLQLLTHVIRTCNTCNKPVTLCGEMAGVPRSFVLLVGMGLRSFSMSPAFVPTIKELASHLTVHEAEEILQRALRLDTNGRIMRFMGEQIERICPNLKLLDTQ